MIEHHLLLGLAAAGGDPVIVRGFDGMAPVSLGLAGFPQAVVLGGAAALKLPYVAIARLNDEGRTLIDEQAGSAFSLQPSAFQVVAEAGSPPAHTLALPLTYYGEAVGQLILGPRAPGQPWSAADRRLLEDLARHAGVAVHAVRLHTRTVQLAADLQQSRERLVMAREEERRRRAAGRAYGCGFLSERRAQNVERRT
jgi:hypothetical protein